MGSYDVMGFKLKKKNNETVERVRVCGAENEVAGVGEC